MECQLSIHVHAIYGPSGAERPLHLPKNSEHPDLANKLLMLFNDLKPQGSKPSDFKIMWFNGKEYVDLPKDQVLHDMDKIKMVYLDKKLRPSRIIPHPISHGMSYYNWSVYSQANDAILKLDDSTKTIKCDGKTTDTNSLIKFKAVDVSTATDHGLIAFTLPSPTADKLVYVVKGQEEDQNIIVEEKNTDDVKKGKISDEFKFDCIQFYGKMQYRCFRTAKGRADLYISAMKDDGSTTLQKAGLHGYPRPSTLFIAADII